MSTDNRLDNTINASLSIHTEGIQEDISESFECAEPGEYGFILWTP